MKSAGMGRLKTDVHHRIGFHEAKLFIKRDFVIVAVEGNFVAAFVLAYQQKHINDSAKTKEK